MKNPFTFISQELKLRNQRSEITALKDSIAQLEKQNESMRQGMRRCVTCDYRIDYKNRNNNPSVNSVD